MWPQNSRLNYTATTAFESLTQVLRRFRQEILFAKKKQNQNKKRKPHLQTLSLHIDKVDESEVSPS